MNTQTIPPHRTMTLPNKNELLPHQDEVCPWYKPDRSSSTKYHYVVSR